MDCCNCPFSGKYPPTESKIIGNRKSVIHGVVAPTTGLFSPYDSGNLSFYENYCQDAFGESLLSYLVFYPAWGCLLPPDKAMTKKAYGACGGFRDDLRGKLIAPYFNILFGSDVIKHEIMRGERCPDFLLNPGRPMRVTGENVKVLLMPDPAVRFMSEQHEEAVRRCAVGLLEVIEGVYQCQRKER